MTDTTLFSPETPAMHYASLSDAVRLLPDVGAFYAYMGGVFGRFLDQHTVAAGIRFAGWFAKTDYLLKEYSAPVSLRRQVNEARVRMRTVAEQPPDVLSSNAMHDLKAVCGLVLLVTGEPAPATLQSLFPADKAFVAQRIIGDSLRVVVDRWDERFVFATADTAEGQEVCVRYAGLTAFTGQEEDRSYLARLLRRGTQLNLIRPRNDGGVLLPELIVVEPDYLVDISSVAAAFEDYGRSPLNALLSRFAPQASSWQTVLGNLAGQMLDDELCSPDVSRSYGATVADYYRRHAMSMLATEMPPDFHSQARTQKQHIANAVHTVLPSVLSRDAMRFDTSEMMLEPTFFSEMLGLQGRMDLLHVDHRLLIEQKSGKCGFPQRDPDTPVMQTKHYVQLLLYMLLLRYNHRRQYNSNGHALHSFLLYSRYANSLLGLSFAPLLVFDALRLRNEMAAAELSYCQGDMKWLASLTADDLNTRRQGGTLWQKFQRPQIEAVLAPIAGAAPLAQGYFFRMLKFVQVEHVLAKVGNRTSDNAGFADKWRTPLPLRLQNGNILLGLRLHSPSASARGRVSSVELLFGDRQSVETSNFRIGDIVILYPYQADARPDARATMVFRATIESMTATTLRLALRAQQTDSRIFWHGGSRLWAVEHDFFESSFGSLYRGLHAFLTVPDERRRLILGQRRPQTDPSLSLRGDYGPFNSLVLGTRRARDFFLIIGPPGTGKTSFGLLNTLREELLSADASVLLMAYTNRAVDEICSKLVESGIDFVRIGGQFVCEQACRPYLVDALVDRSASVSALRDNLVKARVVVGTTTAVNASPALFTLKQFSLAVIDEASQILEPHLLGLLCAVGPDRRCAIRRFVLIGDHKQLPAVVQQDASQSAVDDGPLRAIGLRDCRQSFFERMLSLWGNDADVSYMLHRQGRMHRDIAAFVNREFYGGRLCEVPLPHQVAPLPQPVAGDNGIASLLSTRRLAFVNVDAPPQTVSDKTNRSEAQAIAATLLYIYNKEEAAFSPVDTVGVIVPYRNQIAAIRQQVQTLGIGPLDQVTIDTVERFQGSQRKYILYGFTIQKHYQIEFLANNVIEEDGKQIDRKLNVAMTRAREHLVIFGNAALISHNAVFRRLVDYARSVSSYFSPPLADYVSGHFSVPPVGPSQRNGTVFADQSQKTE